MKNKNLILVILCVMGILFIAHPNKADLTGKIQNYSGVGILFTTLEVYKATGDNELVYREMTDFNGGFRLKNLKPGEYKLVIKADGFDEKVQYVSLTRRDKNLGVIHLNGSVILLEPLTIYEKKS